MSSDILADIFPMPEREPEKQMCHCGTVNLKDPDFKCGQRHRVGPKSEISGTGTPVFECECGVLLSSVDDSTWGYPITRDDDGVNIVGHCDPLSNDEVPLTVTDFYPDVPEKEQCECCQHWFKSDDLYDCPNGSGQQVCEGCSFQKECRGPMPPEDARSRV